MLFTIAEDETTLPIACLEACLGRSVILDQRLSRLAPLVTPLADNLVISPSAALTPLAAAPATESAVAADTVIICGESTGTRASTANNTPQQAVAASPSSSRGSTFQQQVSHHMVCDYRDAATAGEDPSCEVGDPQHWCCPAAQAVAVMARAHTIGGWEQQQTHRSLIPYLQEETGELIAAITQLVEQDPATEQDLAGELADLLLQVLFHAEITRRRGEANFFTLCELFIEKLRTRAPYLFDGTSHRVDPDIQDAIWQEAKQRR
ncbi:Nucleoside triphosphate pyrophosphohydrolase/pyrophosphatase MazG [Corynebacterium choanae]|uniref:Nucleoside triphosphate pyrophosphohydrolase/pyrophosphatase MazG n=2 Tax=Corynebacterium choanae TaxID=1862358 RepID=A0A3G6J4X9_9CORY|nr:Nucleoside triphosphate pyrophosphohydrolase/pyrophosphatase MazG [Corynebacterium choanae]